ncbi:(S)-ureidoglycine aminohydrolase [Desulfovibrio inopinatus]|uniref:(S)-ureidoglycine aminohydrolase n=1 Tax=Desulfovibrio inopinatus TaxID=102109 RepID=UPI00040420F1|nr:(S)-ureidoglycine aminohydrolase [Desulfovibrio inopinatus]
MPYPEGFLKNRSSYEPGKYAVITTEGRVINVVPGIKGCALSILASPKLGANFVQMVGTVSTAGKTTIPYGQAENIETLLFVMDGEGSLDVTVGGKTKTLTAGGYIYSPPGKGVDFASKGDAPVTILLYKQRFIPHPDPEVKQPWMVTGSIRNIEESFYDQMENVFVRDLLPVDEAFDMNFHTLAFLPGGCHPFVETHVQEHGMYIYQGQGLYLLDEQWLPVESGDFIWIAPFCKQACYGTGLERMEYIYSKDCHRDEAI